MSIRKSSKVLTLCLVCILLGTSLAGCGATAEPTTAPQTTEAAPEPTQAAPEPTKVAATQAPEPTQAPTVGPSAAEPSSIVIAIPEDPPSFNAMIADTGYDAMVMELVLLALTDVDAEGNVFPELAAELPTVENGGVLMDEEAWTMVVTWTMRSDVVWADGEPVTADDVVFTWEAISNPETGTWIPGSDYIDSVEKLGDYSFAIHYNTVYPAYLTQFGGEQLVIWPEHYCDASQGFAAWDCGRQPLSDGPYVLKEWEIGDHMIFERHPTYYQAGKPAIEQIIVRIVPDESVRKTMLVGGDADVYMWVTEPIVEDLKDEPNAKVSISPTNRWVMRLFPNLAARGTTDPAASPHPILSDVRVRQAIRMAIDVDTLSQQIFLGYGTPVWTEFFRPPYVCEVTGPEYNPDAAAALLEEAGWTDQNGDGVRECHGCANATEGTLMQMEFMTYAEYGEALELAQQLIAEMLGKIGMKLDLTVVEGTVLWADSASGGLEQLGDFDLDMYDDGYAGVDPTDFLWNYYHSDAAEQDMGWNVGRWLNPEFDALLDEAYTLDEAYRKDLFCQMASILDQQLPQILLFTTINADAYSARMQGVQATSNDIVTWNVADWTLTE